MPFFSCSVSSKHIASTSWVQVTNYPPLIKQVHFTNISSEKCTSAKRKQLLPRLCLTGTNFEIRIASHAIYIYAYGLMLKWSVFSLSLPKAVRFRTVQRSREYQMEFESWWLWNKFFSRRVHRNCSLVKSGESFQRSNDCGTLGSMATYSAVKVGSLCPSLTRCCVWRFMQHKWL